MNYQTTEKDMEELWMVLLSERNQSEKATYCMIITIRHAGDGKTMEMVKKKNQQWLSGVWKEWETIDGTQEIWTVKPLHMIL